MTESTGGATHHRRTLLTTAMGAAVGLSTGVAAAAAPRQRATQHTQIVGRDVDVTRATPEVVRVFKSYFEAKTAADLDATMAHFSRKVTYVDATLGWAWYSRKELYDLFAKLMPTWPKTAASYPTRIVGNIDSALVFFTDTPELFGHEIRPVGAVNFEGGKIVRWVDYWDGRAFTMADIAKQRTSADQFPAGFGEKGLVRTAPRSIRSAVRALSDALGSGDTHSAVSLFHPDALLEDLGLHTTVEGRHSIESFLNSALRSLPYGPGARVRHVSGSERGGGYEWGNPSAPAPRGITALELDNAGLVTRMTSVWDSSLWSDRAISGAQSATILQ